MPVIHFPSHLTRHVQVPSQLEVPGSTVCEVIQNMRRDYPLVADYIIDDQNGTPTNAKDLALAILNIIENNKAENINGLYHFSNAGEASWYDFAKEIFRLGNITCKVKPIPTTEYPTPAERPKYSVMDKSKIVQDFSIKLIDWKESLSNCFSK